MEEYINLIIDKINSVVILSYEGNLVNDDELEKIEIDIENTYGYKVIKIPNATVTII